jgi:hypothetical protein
VLDQLEQQQLELPLLVVVLQMVVLQLQRLVELLPQLVELVQQEHPQQVVNGHLKQESIALLAFAIVAFTLVASSAVHQGACPYLHPFLDPYLPCPYPFLLASFVVDRNRSIIDHLNPSVEVNPYFLVFVASSFHWLIHILGFV